MAQFGRGFLRRKKKSLGGWGAFCGPNKGAKVVRTLLCDLVGLWGCWREREREGEGRERGEGVQWPKQTASLSTGLSLHGPTGLGCSLATVTHGESEPDRGREGSSGFHKDSLGKNMSNLEDSRVASSGTCMTIRTLQCRVQYCGGKRFHIFEIARDISSTTLACEVFKSFFTPSSKTPPYRLNETRFLSNATPRPLYKWPLFFSQYNHNIRDVQNKFIANARTESQHKSSKPNNWQEGLKVRKERNQRQGMLIILSVATAQQRGKRLVFPKPQHILQKTM